jgi:hypothetical protein
LLRLKISSHIYENQFSYIRCFIESELFCYIKWILWNAFKYTYYIFWNIWMNFIYWIIIACGLFVNRVIDYVTMEYLNTYMALKIYHSCYIVYKCCIKIHLTFRNELFMHKWIVKSYHVFIKLISCVIKLDMISNSCEYTLGYINKYIRVFWNKISNYMILEDYFGKV